MEKTSWEVFPGPGELSVAIKALLEWEALEVVEDKKGRRYYIPYLMSDAAECYLCFFEASSKGELSGGRITEARVLTGAEKTGLFFMDEQGGSLTVWFSSCSIRTQLYQYHRILHRWVKGEEHLRRLVYIVGTIYEKGQYLDSSYLNPMEEARGYRALMEDFGMTQEAVAQSVGKSRPAVANALRLLSLRPEVSEMLEAGVLTTGHARALLSVTNRERQLEAAKHAGADLIQGGYLYFPATADEILSIDGVGVGLGHRPQTLTDNKKVKPRQFVFPLVPILHSMRLLSVPERNAQSIRRVP